MDNRPLKWEEFLERIGQTVYLSATPGPYELGRADGDVVEQVIRPTGLVDPEVVVKPTKGQIDDLMHEIRLRTERNERVLVTTLTKKMSEDLTDYLLEQGIRVRYLHSEVDTLRRVELLRELRLGEYDVLVGINLLREGLDLPEVSLVSILDADKEGFLRSGTSLIQTIGRAARNVSGQVHMYADKHHAVDGARRSTRPTGAAPSRSPTTWRTASTRSRCARRSPTSPTSSPREDADTEELLGGPAATRPAARRRVPGCSSWVSRPHAARLRRACPRADLAELIGSSPTRCTRPPPSSQFEVAARLRDEIRELKKELRRHAGRRSRLTISMKVAPCRSGRMRAIAEAGPTLRRVGGAAGPVPCRSRGRRGRWAERRPRRYGARAARARAAPRSWRCAGSNSSRRPSMRPAVPPVPRPPCRRMRSPTRPRYLRPRTSAGMAG